MVAPEVVVMGCDKQTKNDDVEELVAAMNVVVAKLRKDANRHGVAQQRPTQDLGDVADRCYRLRRRRDKVFGGLFADPAYDMLLDLFSASSRGRAISITSLATASMAPPTTGLRYIEMLLQRGLITRVPDSDDRRKSYLRLTPDCHDMLARHLADVSTFLE